MKRTTSRALLMIFSAAVLLLTACSKTSEQGKHIPKTAALVFGINSKQIQEKLITEGLSVDKVFEAVQGKDTSNEIGKALKEAKNSGVDLEGDAFIALVPGDKGNGYASAILKLKDAAKFEAFLKEKTKKEIKAGTDFKYIIENDGLVGFNKETMIGVYNINTDKFDQMGKYGEESADSAAPADPATDEKAKVEILNKLFHLKADESVASIESFKEVQKEKGDVFFWMSSEQIYAFNPGTPSGMAALVTTNVKKLTAGAYQTAAVHFESGKIKVNSLAYAGKEIMEIMKKYPMDKVNVNALESYPSENVLGFALMNFDLRILGDIIKLMGMDGFANMGLAETGLTMDDILKAFTGEIALVGSDFSVESKPSEWDSTYKVTKPSIKWVFNMKVGDKAAFEKVMNTPMVGQMFTKQGNDYVPNQPMGEIALSINDKRILAASDQSLLTTYSAGKSKVKMDESILSKSKGNVLSMYLSVEKLVNNIPADEMKLPDSVMNDVKGLLKDFTVVTEPSNGKSQRSVMELNFKNENQNTLVQIVNFSKKMFEYYTAHKKQQDEEWANESENIAVDSAVSAEAVTAAPAPSN